MIALNKGMVGGLAILAGVLCMTTLLPAVVNDTRLADAAMSGDLKTVRSLLKQGADVNGAQGDGQTALHWAAYKDDAEMARILISAGANASAAARINAMTPLFIAAQAGHPAMIEVLLNAGAKANARLTTGATPLMYAARSGNTDAVKILLEHGAEIDAIETARGETALMFAAANNRAPVIRLLMQHGANGSLSSKIVDIAAKIAAESGRGRGRGGLTPGQAAPPVEPLSTQRGQAPPVQPQGGRGNGGGNNLLDEERPGKIDTMGGLTPLLFAARQGYMDATKALLDGGVDINQASPGDKTTPLLMATINAHFDLAKFLLDKGANPKLASNAGATPLYTTINVKWAGKTDYPQPDASQEETSYLDLLKAFLQHGADPNARITRELWFTAYNGSKSRTDPEGATTFWRAAQVADVVAMRLLVAAGADPFIKTRDGVSALNAASGAGFHGNDEITATPAGWLPAVQYLVDELHANVNEGDDKEGFTPLHNAAGRGDNAMILFLVSRGARADAVAKKGETTADMANGPRQRIQPFPETVALLLALGSNNSHKCVSC